MGVILPIKAVFTYKYYQTTLYSIQCIVYTVYTRVYRELCYYTPNSYIYMFRCVCDKHCAYAVRRTAYV